MRGAHARERAASERVGGKFDGVVRLRGSRPPPKLHRGWKIEFESFRYGFVCAAVRISGVLFGVR